VSQAARILDYLKTGKHLTPVEAQVNFGCFRLAARVDDLRKKGHPVITFIKENPVTKAKYASYSLVPEIHEGSTVRVNFPGMFAHGRVGTVRSLKAGHSATIFFDNGFGSYMLHRLEVLS
jgi:hypothetical protein